MVKWFVGSKADYTQPFVRRNFVANVTDGALFAFGLSFVSLNTVLPLFVKKMGGSSLAVGLIPVIWIVGFNIPQILVANFTQRFPLKKGLFLRTAFVQRLPWLLLAFFSFWMLESIDTSAGLFLFFTGFALAAIGGSLNLPVWFDLISKVTPVRLRGRLFAMRAILGALLGVLGGFVAKQVLNTLAFPQSFGVLFLLAFAAYMISYVCLFFLKETGPSPLRQGNYREYVRNLPVILKENRNFRNFLIADALLTAAVMAEAFFAVNAFEQFNLDDGYAGQFTMVLMVTMIVANLFFGQISDHYGHKLNLTFAGISATAACIIAMVVPNVLWYHLVFVFTSITIALKHVSRQTIVAELCPEEDRATYIALTNMVTSPFVLLAVVAGWIADQVGYNAIFAVAGLLALASAVWMGRMVVEPRNRDIVFQKAQVNI